ncbi:hypothetical protein D3C73_1292970 [compost metagenome]
MKLVEQGDNEVFNNCPVGPDSQPAFTILLHIFHLAFCGVQFPEGLPDMQIQSLSLLC